MTKFQATIHRIQTDADSESKLILVIPKVYLTKVSELKDLLEYPIVVEIEKADIKRGEDPSEAQFKKSEMQIQELGLEKEQKEGYLLFMFKKRHRNELTKQEMSQFIDFLEGRIESQRKGE